MKIAMFGSWNTDSGASIHAELIGRAWVEKGIDLKVFTFYRHSFHGTTLTKKPEEEEEYVTRCFEVFKMADPKMDAAPILKADYDVFVVQDLGMLPIRRLLRIFPEIKKKAKTVNIIHDGKRSEIPGFFDFEWDQVVCFDRRYYDFLEEVYPKDRISIIPYPAFPLRLGDKVKARVGLGLPGDKKIVLLFGPAAEYAVDTVSVLEKLADKYDIMMLVVAKVEPVLKQFRCVQPAVKFDLRIIEESPDMERLYEYLHAADCMIYNKPSRPWPVVSSTAFQCMGSGCPILAYTSNFTYSFDKEILKYCNHQELEENLIDVFEQGSRYREQQKALVSYLEDKAADAVAEKFLRLFENLLKE